MRTTRRHAVQALAASILCAALPALAQQSRVWRIGFLVPTSAQASASWRPAFRQGMAELGWVEKRDYVIDARYANGAHDAVERLASELVAAKPDLLLTPADTSALTLVQRTASIPVVFAVGQVPLRTASPRACSVQAATRPV